MKKLIIFFSVSLFSTFTLIAQGYKIGDKVTGFELKNVDGELISLADYANVKGVVIIFTCNHCPYAKAYENRIIEIDKKYKPKGFPVVAINPNDPKQEPEDSYSNMIIRAKDKGFTFPYLFDETQDVLKEFGATKTPHVFLLQKKGNDFFVRYIGAIDDNYEDPAMVTNKYLANAIDNLIEGRSPNPAYTKAIGCSIKKKE
jgi:peroxiredoxin